MEDDNTEVIFTNPYVDVRSGELIVTVAAPVYDSSDATLLLGVVGIDMDFTDIDNSIKDLRVIDSEGYAYLLAPGGEGEVATHKDLQAGGGTQFITELESGVDAEEFGAIVRLMSESCTGFETYSRDGDIWMLSWSHETTSVSNVDGTNACGDGGFIAAVTVNEATLLEVRVRWKGQRDNYYIGRIPQLFPLPYPRIVSLFLRPHDVVTLILSLCPGRKYHCIVHAWELCHRCMG